MTASVTYSFPHRERQPASILWSGILAFEDPSKPDDSGRPALILKVQASLMEGRNGRFLSMPGVQRMRNGVLEYVRDKRNNVITYVTLGRMFQDAGVAAVLEEMSKPTRSEIAQARAEAGEGQTEAFDDLPF